MPKSSSLTVPSAVDEHVRRLDVAMHDELAVRELHRVADSRNSCRRAREIEQLRSRSTASSGSPSTYSIAKYGRPSSAMPPSSRRAMFGCSSRARICRSRRKRAQQACAVHAALDQLQRGALLELAVGALGEIARRPCRHGRARAARARARSRRPATAFSDSPSPYSAHATATWPGACSSVGASRSASASRRSSAVDLVAERGSFAQARSSASFRAASGSSIDSSNSVADRRQRCASIAAAPAAFEPTAMRSSRNARALRHSRNAVRVEMPRSAATSAHRKAREDVELDQRAERGIDALERVERAVERDHVRERAARSRAAHRQARSR